MKKSKMNQLKINTNPENWIIPSPKDSNKISNYNYSSVPLSTKGDKKMIKRLLSPVRNVISLPNGENVSTSSKNKKQNLANKLPLYPKDKTTTAKKIGSNIISFVKSNEKNKFPTIKNNKSDEENLIRNGSQNKLTVKSPKITNSKKINNGNYLSWSSNPSSSNINDIPSSQLTTQTNSISNSPKIGESNNESKLREPAKVEPNPMQESISVSSLINNQNIPLALSNLSVFFPFYETTKCSTKALGVIKAYAANTYQGIIRNYNEDRVSIILNISRPNNHMGPWPKCSFFGIYDGHGGNLCADFLRDKLHTYVIQDEHFPQNPEEALKRGFENAETDFINQEALSKNFKVIDRSGSCAVVALLVEDVCYVANVGDSRAVFSQNGGKEIQALSNDHKPNEEGENRRIIENGGRVYQTQTPARLINMPNINCNNSNQVLLGPYRVFPGRLSVSRTFGDIEAKLPKLGGLQGVVIAVPEIKVFKITEKIDCLILGCDGIFDQLSNKDAVDSIWMTMKDEAKTRDIHSQIALGVDMIMKSSLVRRTLDNVTVLVIAFKNMETVFNQGVKSKRDNFSPKSSLYLYNVIENKEHIVSDSNNYYCNTDPDKVSSPTSPSRGLKNGGRINKISVEEKSQLRKVKSVSPTFKDIKENNYQHSKVEGINFTKLNKVNLDLKNVIVSPKYKRITEVEKGIHFFLIHFLFI